MFWFEFWLLLIITLTLSPLVVTCCDNPQGQTIKFFQHKIETIFLSITVKPVFKSRHSKEDPKYVFNIDYRLMQVKSIAECSKRSILQYFWPSIIKLSFVIKIFCFVYFWLAA